MGETSIPFIPTRASYVKPVIRDHKDVHAAAWEYLEGRGISKEILEAFQITGSRYTAKDGQVIDAIVFPHYVNQELISVQYRRINEKIIRNATDTEMVLYNFDNIEDEVLIIVEGHIDALSVATAGYTSVTTLQTGGVQPGSKDNSIRFEPLDKAVDRLSSVKRIILFCDNDEPGFLLEAEFIRRLGAKRCWRVQHPPECKDANDVLMQYGAAYLKAIIDQAKLIPIAGIITGADIFRDLEALLYNKIQPGEDPGFPNLAEHYRVPAGQWTLWSGAPGTGKSNLADAVDVNLNEQYDWRCGYYSPEMQPIARHSAQLIQKKLGKPFNDLTKQELNSMKEWIADGFYWIQPPDNRTLPRVLDYMATLVARYGIKKVRLDPWNRFEHIDEAGDPLKYLAKSLDLISQFARDMSVHVDLVAHPTKLRYDFDGRICVPGPYDISGGAHFFNIADFIIVVDRDTREYGGIVDVYIFKVRFQEHGRTGRVSFNFDIPSGRYYPAPLRVIDRGRKRANNDESF